ncbi:MAG: response regulator [Desulfatitalea sp.]|nr:response regulator [Desulfatitalea sp.]
MSDPAGTNPSVRMLRIDDEKGFVATLAKRLARRNIQATQAYSGREGIQALRRQDFDVVVLDLKMEDMDGLEVLKIIKIMAPDLPVIMLSGHASDEAARTGIEAGAFDYLTKPYDLNELLDKIGAVLGQKK